MVKYTCERCAKEFDHRGDYCKHLDRKTACAGGENAPTLKELKDRLAKLEAEVHNEKIANPEEKLITAAIHPVSKQVFLDMIAKDGNVTADNVEYNEYIPYLRSYVEKDGVAEKYTPDVAAKWRRKAIPEDLFKKYHVFDVIGQNAKKNISLAEYRKWFKEFTEVITGANVNVEEAAEELPEDIKKADVDGTISKFNTMVVRMENALYRIGVVGTSARDGLIPIIILRLLEKHFESGTIDVMDIEKYEYSEYRIDENNIKYVLLKNYAELDAASASDMLRTIWEHVLSQHPVTSKIFESGKYVEFRNDNVLMSIIQELIKFDFESCSTDNLSLAYQHFIHRQFKGENGSRMGQHFTPDKLIDMMIREYGDHIPAEGKYIDPFMGTAGFIMAMYNSTKEDRNEENPSEYLHGVEIDPNVFKYAFTNLLVQTGTACTGIKNESAFVNHAGKYSAVFTNPPFGKTIDSHEKKNTVSYNFAKVANRNLVCLQYCMHILAPGGVCSMVWVNGAECFGNSKAAIAVRQKLFTEFHFLGAIMVPGQKKVFEHAGIKPIILTFKKPLEGEIVIPSLKMLECDENCENVKLVAEIGAEKLEEKNYVISVDEYKEQEELKVSDEFEVKILGEVCEFRSGKFQSNQMSNRGNIPFYNCSAKNPVGTHEESSFNYDEKYILLVSAGGSENNKYGDGVGLGKVYLVQGETACMAGVYSIISKSANIDVQYLYYYLRCNKKMLADSAVYTTNLGVIKRDKISKLQIPIPTLEKQAEIVKLAQKLEKQVDNYQNVIDGLEWEIEAIKQNNPFAGVDCEIKTLGEVCEIKNGTRITKKNVKEGKYPVYGGGDSHYNHDEYNRSGTTLIVSRFGVSENCVRIIDGEIFLNDSAISLHSKTNLVDQRFLNYVVCYMLQKRIYDSCRGSAQKNINMEIMKELQIPVPSLEKQAEIAAAYQKMENDINEVEKTRDNLKKYKIDAMETMKKIFS